MEILKYIDGNFSAKHILWTAFMLKSERFKPFPMLGSEKDLFILIQTSEMSHDRNTFQKLRYKITL